MFTLKKKHLNINDIISLTIDSRQKKINDYANKYINKFLKEIEWAARDGKFSVTVSIDKGWCQNDEQIENIAIKVKEFLDGEGYKNSFNITYRGTVIFDINWNFEEKEEEKLTKEEILKELEGLDRTLNLQSAQNQNYLNLLSPLHPMMSFNPAVPPYFTVGCLPIMPPFSIANP